MKHITKKVILGEVPAIVGWPDHLYEKAPVVLLWHGFGYPASEEEFASALPLHEVPAVKVYLGLSLFGSRPPEGGHDELMVRQAEDYPNLLFEPAVGGAVSELPSVWEALNKLNTPYQLGPEIAVVGFSGGGLVPLCVLVEQDSLCLSKLVTAGVVINGVPRLLDLVRLVERLSGTEYEWSEKSRRVAERFDFIARAREFVGRTDQSSSVPRMLLLNGAADEYFGAKEMANFKRALEPFYEGNESSVEYLIQADLSHHFGPTTLDLPFKISDPALVEGPVARFLIDWCLGQKQ